MEDFMNLLLNAVNNPETAFDVIIYLEKTAMEFYLKSMENTVDERLKSLFKTLADEEKGHLDKFNKLQRLLVKDSSDDDGFYGEYGRFIQIISEQVTSTLKFSKELDVQELITMALNFEKDSLLILNELKNCFDTSEAIRMVKLVYNEEKKHYLDLNLMLRELSG